MSAREEPHRNRQSVFVCVAGSKRVPGILSPSRAERPYLAPSSPRAMTGGLVPPRCIGVTKADAPGTLDTARLRRNRSCAMAILAMPEHGQDARGTKCLHAAQNLGNSSPGQEYLARKGILKWASDYGHRREADKINPCNVPSVPVTLVLRRRQGSARPPIAGTRRGRWRLS